MYLAFTTQDPTTSNNYKFDHRFWIIITCAALNAGIALCYAQIGTGLSAFQIISPSSIYQVFLPSACLQALVAVQHTFGTLASRRVFDGCVGLTFAKLSKVPRFVNCRVILARLQDSTRPTFVMFLCLRCDEDHDARFCPTLGSLWKFDSTRPILQMWPQNIGSEVHLAHDCFATDWGHPRERENIIQIAKTCAFLAISGHPYSLYMSSVSGYEGHSSFIAVL